MLRSATINHFMQFRYRQAVQDPRVPYNPIAKDKLGYKLSYIYIYIHKEREREREITVR